MRHRRCRWPPAVARTAPAPLFTRRRSFFGGLKDEFDRACDLIFHARKNFGDSKFDGHVNVVAASVFDSGILRLVRDIDSFLNGQRVHIGADGDDTLYGGYGQDSVSGGRGNDRLTGDEGNDILAGGTGNDEAIGGAGNDLYKFQRGDGVDVLIDALTNEWDVVWISGQGGQNGYTVNPDGTITHTTYGTLFDGTNWNARTRYDVETGTLYRHRPANPDAIVANAASFAAVGATSAGIVSAKLALRKTPIHAHIA